VLIAREGIDGSGKGTQAAILARRFEANGWPATLLRFPQYEKTFFGREVGRYLNGGYGTLEEVHPKFSSLLYALDRFQALETITGALQAGQHVICDRYTGSNIAHQAARVPAAEKAEMMAWIEHVEEQVLHLPRPDIVIFLDVEVSDSQRMVAQKDARDYTDKTYDLHEASGGHLALALANFRALAQTQGWVRIQCNDAQNRFRTPEAIAQDIYDAVVRAGSLA
jgi:dTMP kinase